MTGTLIMAGIAVAIQLGLAIWTTGKLTEKVTGQGNWIKTLDADVKSHETRISHLEGALN